MKIFIDSADLDEIKLACSWGIIDGATTNPSLIKRSVDRRGGKVGMEEYIKEIVRTVPGPVSLEVIALRSVEMISQARTLYKKLSPYGDVTVKIPINPSTGDEASIYDGLKAIKKLSDEGIPTNATLIMTPGQALLAAKAGATYASPFIGRIDDFIRTKLGMKAGIDFQRGDYFEAEAVKKAFGRRINDYFGDKHSTSCHETIKDICSLLKMEHDNGVFSGVDLVRRILKIYKNYGFKTEVIAASIRNTRQVREVAELGVHIATVPFNVLKEMIRHYKTLEGIRIFTEDVVPDYEKLFF